MRTLYVFAAVCLFLSIPDPAAAQWVPVAEKQGFGQALDAAEGTVFVGDPANTYTPGQVSVYEEGANGRWVHQTFLTAEDAQLDDRFGSALDADGSVLVVGAPAVNAAYVFRRHADGWSQVGRVMPSDSTVEFGAQVAVRGDRLFVAASTPVSGASEGEDDEGRGVVYVFSREDGGDWEEEAMLQHDDLSAGGFGEALLATGDQLVVGAPDQGSGAVAFYHRGDSEWTNTQTLTVERLTDGAQFGGALLSTADGIAIGAPRANGARGSVFLAEWDGEAWSVERRLAAFDGASNDAFGASLAYEDNTLWVGAPGVARETGALYRFDRSGGSWSGARRISPPAPREGDNFGATMGTVGATVAVGIPGGNYGAGTMALYSTSNDAWSDDSPVSPPETNVFSAMTGEEITCSEGSIEDFACENVNLHAFMPNKSIGAEGGVELNDIWGWTDPQTGTEYALVGRADGTSFVDVSDPNNPVYVGQLLMTEGSHANSWRDIKVYKDHAFIVADNVGDHGMQVFDLTQLRDVDATDMPVTFEATAHYDRIHSAHNVAINKDTGYAYIVGGSGGGQTCGGGLHMVNIQDPLNPTFEGCFGGDRGAGSGGTGSTHDTQCIVYEGPDQEYEGNEVCVAYNETEIAVVDVTNKDNPTLISTASYPNFGYVHQGWFTDNQRYMYSNDEGDEIAGNVDRTRTIVWDMQDLDNPVVANEFYLSNTSSDHNLYVKGDRMYQSNYKSGLRVLDITNPEQPEEIGHFDLFPPSDTPGFEGTWSNYPYFESGIIVTSTYDGGFFVLEYSEPEL